MRRFEKGDVALELVELGNHGEALDPFFLVVEGPAAGQIQRIYLDLTEAEILDLTAKWREQVFARRRARA